MSELFGTGPTSKAYRNYDKKRFHGDGPSKEQLLIDLDRKDAKDTVTYKGKVYSPNSKVRKPSKIGI